MIKRNNINRRAEERRKQDLPVEFERRIVSERRSGEERRDNFA